MAEKSTPYGEGIESGHKNYLIQAGLQTGEEIKNPYPKNTPEHEEWNKGEYDGNQDEHSYQMGDF